MQEFIERMQRLPKRKRRFIFLVAIVVSVAGVAVYMGAVSGYKRSMNRAATNAYNKSIDLPKMTEVFGKLISGTDRTITETKKEFDATYESLKEATEKMKELEKMKQDVERMASTPEGEQATGSAASVPEAGQ